MTTNQLEWNKLQETKRANLAKEAETVRSNLEKEKENFRSNTAKEEETHRSNVEKEISDRAKALNNPFSLVSYFSENPNAAQAGVSTLWDNVIEGTQATFKPISDAIDNAVQGIKRPFEQAIVQGSQWQSLPDAMKDLFNKENWKWNN